MEIFLVPFLNGYKVMMHRFQRVNFAAKKTSLSLEANKQLLIVQFCQIKLLVYLRRVKNIKILYMQVFLNYYLVIKYVCRLRQICINLAFVTSIFVVVERNNQDK